MVDSLLEPGLQPVAFWRQDDNWASFSSAVGRPAVFYFMFFFFFFEDGLKFFWGGGRRGVGILIKCSVFFCLW